MVGKTALGAVWRDTVDRLKSHHYPLIPHINRDVGSNLNRSLPS